MCWKWRETCLIPERVKHEDSKTRKPTSFTLQLGSGCCGPNATAEAQRRREVAADRRGGSAFASFARWGFHSQIRWKAVVAKVCWHRDFSPQSYIRRAMGNYIRAFCVG